MCNLTTGREEPCFDSIGGIDWVGIKTYESYDHTEVTITDGVITSITGKPNFYIWQTENANLTETINNEEDGIYYSQNLTFTLLKQDLLTTKELDSIKDLFFHVIVKLKNGIYKFLGLFNGCSIDNIELTSGSGKSDLNGYNVTMSGEEFDFSYDIKESFFTTTT